MPLIVYNGGLLAKNGSLAASLDCCCCCCESITLNDLLYGDKEYSWATIKPSGDRTPAIGSVGNPPSVSSTHCTDAKQANDAATLAACCNEITPGVFQWTCGWKLRPACLRWLCRCVDAEFNLLCEKTYGGPTTNNASLSELAIDEFGAETEGGCYVYTFEFFAWHRRGARRGNRLSDFRPRDDVYTIYKTKVTSCPQ